MATEQLLKSIIADSAYLTPEIYLSVVLMLFILLTPFCKQFIQQFGGLLGLISLLPAIYLTSTQAQLVGSGSLPLFGNMLLLDGEAIFFKYLFLGSGVLFYLYHMVTSVEDDDEQTGEYHFMIFSSLVAMQLLVMSSNMLMAFIALETLSLSNYALVLFGSGGKRPEAALKYIVFGAVVTCIMLFASAILFALHGSLSFDVLFRQTVIATPFVVNVFSFLFVTGALFKLSLAPLHVWVPDVYQNVPYKLAAFFSFGPKVAGLGLIINVLVFNFEGALSPQVANVLGVLILASLFIGNLSALSQHHAKRLLAYSSIAHSGFLVIGVFVFGEVGISATLFYAVSYLVLNYAGFYIVELASKLTGSFDIKSFSGLGIRRPLLGVLTVVVMIGLTGLPPTIGFLGKVWVFTAVWNHAEFALNNIYFWVLILGMFNVAIALFYYLRIPYYMYFKTSIDTVQPTLSTQHYALAMVLSALVIGLFFMNNIIFDFIHLLNN